MLETLLLSTIVLGVALGVAAGRLWGLKSAVRKCAEIVSPLLAAAAECRPIQCIFCDRSSGVGAAAQRVKDGR